MVDRGQVADPAFQWKQPVLLACMKSGHPCSLRVFARSQCLGTEVSRQRVITAVVAVRPLPRVERRSAAMTIPFGEPEPSDALLNKSVSSTRLRSWLNERLRRLASAQRIQDARALRREFSLE